MRARDVMTTSVITTGPDTPVAEVAALLLENRISGVPIVDHTGDMLGIVTEGDLVRRPDIGTGRQPSWWLRIVGDPNQAQTYVKSHGRFARDVMTKNVITVDVETDLGEVAERLEKHRIKRVPVLQDGKLVGLVSRANLIAALMRPAAAADVADDDAGIRGAMVAALAEAGLQAHLLSVVVSDKVVQVYGFVRSEDELAAVKVAADNVAGIARLENHVAITEGSPYPTRWSPKP